MQAEVVRSEQMVRITEKQALAVAETAKGEGQATRLRAAAEAEAMRVRGEAEAAATRSVGEAKAAAYHAGIEAMGASSFGALQLAIALGEHHVKLVPDIAVGGDGQNGLASVLVGRMLAASLPPARE